MINETPTHPQNVDNRRYPRVAVAGLSVRVNGADAPHRVLDVNLSGMAFETAPGRPLTRDQQVTLEIVPPSKDPGASGPEIHIPTARVVHSSDWRTGCEFRDMNPDLANRLFSVVIGSLARIVD